MIYIGEGEEYNVYDINYGRTYYVGELEGDTYTIESIYDCREEVQKYYLRDRMNDSSATILLTITDLIFEEYCQFIKLLEKRLNIQDTLKIDQVSGGGCPCVAITISSWWLKSKIRQEFLTIALRAYCDWKNDQDIDEKEKFCEHLDLETILKSESYFMGTWDAVLYFLSGKTLMKTGYAADTGWFTRFSENKISKGLNSWERSLVGEDNSENQNDDQHIDGEPQEGIADPLLQA